MEPPLDDASLYRLVTATRTFLAETEGLTLPCRETLKAWLTQYEPELTQRQDQRTKAYYAYRGKQEAQAYGKKVVWTAKDERVGEMCVQCGTIGTECAFTVMCALCGRHVPRCTCLKCHPPDY